MSLRGTQVLVTGAGGFIGSHLVEALVREGAKVRALVRYNSRNLHGWLDASDVHDELEILAGDVRDPDCVQRAVDGCSVVFHLAALIGIPYSYEAPGSYVDTNILGTLNVLQAAMRSGVDRVVHTSTSEVYGTAKRVPIDEEHPLQGQSPYSATKIAADKIAESFYHSFGLPVVTVRPFNTFGPRQSARAIIPTIISQLSSGAPVLRLGSLTPTRDFTYVTDTAAGFIAAARAEAVEGEVVNLGANFEISVAELAKMIGKIMEAPITLESETARIRPESSEVMQLRADNSKAAKLLHWTPTYAGADGLRQGLAQTIKWFRNPNNLAMYRPASYTV